MSITVRTRALYGTQVERICGDMAQVEDDWSLGPLADNARSEPGSMNVIALAVLLIPFGLAGWALIITVGKALANVAYAAVNGGM